MKLILLVLYCILAGSSFAQQSGTVSVSAPIAPLSSASPYGATIPNQGYGGIVTGGSLSNFQDLSWYPLARRHANQLFSDTNNGVVYQLRNDLTTLIPATGILNAATFGVIADGSTDNTVALQACIDFAEANGYTTLFLPPSLLTYKWSTITNKYLEIIGGYGTGYNGTLVEQITGTTNNFIVLNPPPPTTPRFYATTAGPQPSVRNMTLIGHSEGNLVAPKAITTITDRLNFSVATGDLPYTGSVLITNTFPFFGHVFFYSSLDKYCGHSVITNIDYGTGLITLMDHSDNYATPVNAGGILTNTMKVCFSQVVTESSAFSTETFIDGATAGTSGIYITSTDAAAISSKILLENLSIYGFHCGIRSGSTILARFKSIETKFCAYAGWADANPGNTRDGSIDDIFVFGKYQPNFNASEGGVTESVTYDNPGFRAPAYGFYGQIASGEMKTMAVNFTVDGWYSKNAASTRVAGCLMEGIIGNALKLDGSKFGNGNSTMQIQDLEIRSLSTNEVAYPTLASWTNKAAIYYQNTGVGAPNYIFNTVNFSRLVSTQHQFDFGIWLVNSDSLFAIDQIGMTNAISGNMLATGSATPAMIGRYNVNGVTGYSIEANTLQIFGSPFIQTTSAGNTMRFVRTDLTAGTEADFFMSNPPIWTGTSLIGWAFESGGGLFLKDTDATRATFIRSLANGSTTDYVSFIEPSFDGTDNVIGWGGGSANAYAATRHSIRVAANNTTVTGTELIRYTTVGGRMATGGVGGNTSADALMRWDSTTQGILPPRMDSTQRDAISTPTDGLLIYNSTVPAFQGRVAGAWSSLSGGGGGGNVSNTGTPLDNQIAVWTDATTIEGTTGLTYSGGTVTATTFSGALSGNATTSTALATGRTLGITGDLVWTSPSFNGSGNVTASGTLATVNSSVGSFGNSSYIPTITVNGKGLITSVTTNAASGGGNVNNTGTPLNNQIAVWTAATTIKGVAGFEFDGTTFSAPAASFTTMSIGSLVVTNAIPVTAGGTGIATGTSGGIPYFSASTTIASSAALAANSLVKGGGAGVAPSTITTGTGILTALGINTGSAGAPVLFNGALGTPSSGTLTSATGLPISTGVSGLGTGIATALAVNTGSAGAPVLFNGSVGTPNAGTIDAANVVLKQTKHLFLMRPDYGDGSGAVPQTNSYVASGLMHWTFSGSAETNVNYVVYETIVPPDIDTSVAMTATYTFVSGGTDADDVVFHITYALGASGTALPTGTSIATSPIAITKTPTTPASGDVQVSAATTLTSWAGSMTAGTPLLIRVARLNNSNDDTARDMSLNIAYGSTQ